MSWGDWLVWGFAATVVLTTVLAATQGLGLTRMSVPYLLGTMLTADRDRAKAYGIAFHLVNGWIFSLAYVGAFESLGRASWWLGALIGVLHASFVLGVALPALPGMHPRMASETHGPSAARSLEPPGFLALNYGRRTPLATLAAHALYGAILGGFYRLA